MDFTETQAEILVNSWALAAKGRGQVLTPGAYPDAIELAEAGWLERRSEHDARRAGGGPRRPRRRST
jgi:hypothetical protein